MAVEPILDLMEYIHRELTGKKDASDMEVIIVFRTTGREAAKLLHNLVATNNRSHVGVRWWSVDYFYLHSRLGKHDFFISSQSLLWSALPCPMSPQTNCHDC